MAVPSGVPASWVVFTLAEVGKVSQSSNHCASVSMHECFVSVAMLKRSLSYLGGQNTSPERTSCGQLS